MKVTYAYILLYLVVFSGCATTYKAIQPRSERIEYFQSYQGSLNTLTDRPLVADSVHIVLPTPVVKDTPIYPDMAFRSGAEGTAVVQVLVDSMGIPIKCIIYSSDAEIYKECILISASRWRFTSLMIDGTPHPFIARMKFRFYIVNGSPIVMVPF